MAGGVPIWEAKIESQEGFCHSGGIINWGADFIIFVALDLNRVGAPYTAEYQLQTECQMWNAKETGPCN